MFNIIVKKKNDQAIKRSNETITLTLSGMHCTSCALNIDGVLEENPGVYESNTSYAKSITTVSYNPEKITPEAIKQIITSTGYEVVSNRV